MRQITETKVAIGDTTVWFPPNCGHSKGHVILVCIKLVPEIHSPRTAHKTKDIVTFHSDANG